jgi:hypothetical protein
MQFFHLDDKAHVQKVTTLKPGAKAAAAPVKPQRPALAVAGSDFERF